jgi:hypothetical protein
VVGRGEREIEANAHVLRFVQANVSSVHVWEFMCECGEANCHEFVRLTLAAFVALRDRGEGVFAAGHHASAPGRTLA